MFGPWKAQERHSPTIMRTCTEVLPHVVSHSGKPFQRGPLLRFGSLRASGLGESPPRSGGGARRGVTARCRIGSKEVTMRGQCRLWGRCEGVSGARPVAEHGADERREEEVEEGARLGLEKVARGQESDDTEHLEPDSLSPAQ